jgi:hypothetical protein
MSNSIKGKKKSEKIKVNWNRIITLSAAGQYIQDELAEELKKIKNLCPKNK